MEFELNRTQKDIQKAVRDFQKGEFDKDLAFELEKKHEFPTQNLEEGLRSGTARGPLSGRILRPGPRLLEDILVIEELCRGDSTIGSAVALSVFASEIIMHNGTESKKRNTCPRWPKARCSPPAHLPSRTTARTSPS
jgi:alkylation response protein AidB-like acyl-CoA dehydrogenase